MRQSTFARSIEELDRLFHAYVARAEMKPQPDWIAGNLTNLSNNISCILSDIEKNYRGNKMGRDAAIIKNATNLVKLTTS